MVTKGIPITSVIKNGVIVIIKINPSSNKFIVKDSMNKSYN